MTCSWSGSWSAGSRNPDHKEDSKCHREAKHGQASIPDFSLGRETSSPGIEFTGINLFNVVALARLGLGRHHRNASRDTLCTESQKGGFD